jgi:predicted permease
MNEILTLLLPFFGLFALGYGAGRLGMVAADGVAGLDILLRYAALPVFFFISIAASPPADLSLLWFALTCAFATYCAFAIAFSAGALINGGNVPEATIQGLAGSYSNIAYLAPALTIAAFGPTSGTPTALIFSFDFALACLVTPLMMALGGTVRTNPQRLATEIGRNVLFHPIVIATALGLAAAGLGVRLPGPIDATLSFIGGMAPPVALFALGLTTSFRQLGPVSLEMPAVIAVKLLVQPLIVYLLLSWIGGFDPVWVNTAVLLAALPPAMTVVNVAQHYRVYANRAATSVLLAMIASAVTVTVLLVLLVNGVLPDNPFR